MMMTMILVKRMAAIMYNEDTAGGKDGDEDDGVARATTTTLHRQVHACVGSANLVCNCRW